MARYIINNDIIRIIPDASIKIETKLPLGTYTVVPINPMTGELGLKNTDNFEKPLNVYGEAEAQSERIINTFENRSNNTGVLLGGEKGSGKTFLAKYISWKILQRGYSTIMINEQFDTGILSELIRNIPEPCLIIFDEFEKIYSKENEDDLKNPQNGLLTLLDGLLITKKLFIFTCNDCECVTTMMRNRPGRIFYNIDFGGLSAETIKEYCEINLINPGYTDEICGMRRLFGKFTFDMLKALVEEVNRYGESPTSAVRMMNIIPEYMKSSYTVHVRHIKTNTVYHNYFEYEDNTLWANIFAKKVATIEIWKAKSVKTQKNVNPAYSKRGIPVDGFNKCDAKGETIAFGVEHLVTQNENEIIYDIGDKYRVILSPVDTFNTGRRLWDMVDPYAHTVI